MSHAKEPWLISIHAATVTEWHWDDKNRRWRKVEWDPVGGFTFTDIARADVTSDGRDDFILKARDSRGRTIGAVLVNTGRRADWAEMQGLDHARHGAAVGLGLSGTMLISDYAAQGTVSSVGGHDRTVWRYKGYHDGYPVFAESRR